ncbi:helix-turn-helix transcriptional regulator [Proteiniborus sp. MB09-C3]|uniref:helix-turn-helix domain-containing protein n=1 Tax=Proteiniborus sp. MB09-C3 TaxID=3050072 RepID=UPI0025546017|nr:helix-turn-helix transcriptional regulator [Proteiniborus sp. MB09-C3]WIV13678.1 helix-turn-helix transcriptional regulator [Proteiniborus sp. MB09-C3]
MQIGEVIREYRKRKNMTQEEMANRLGVTAPAVNKWENGNSQPDIMLLVPIARLLNITLDTLLSFQEELTAEDINSIVYEIDAKLKDETYEDAFQWAKGKIEQYPNCEQLIWQMALILDAWRLAKDIPDSEKYEDYINDCYVRALGSEDENIRNRAADSLFGFYSRKEQYEKAEEYLNYFSSQNPERKRKQAFIYSKTNQVNEAYKAYEELLFSGYQMMNMVFQSIYTLAMQDKDREKAYILVEKQRELVNIFEMGEYHEASCRLDLATAEKDVEATIETMEGMLASADKICDFTKANLYEHMEFKKPEEKFITELHNSLLTCFRDEEAYSYMKKSRRWQELVSSNSNLLKD